MSIPKGFDTAAPMAPEKSTRDAWYVGNRFIKRAGPESEVESVVSDAFRETKTPGAYKTGYKDHGNSRYSISEKLTGKQLNDVDDHELSKHLGSVGNIILSELLGGVADRHGDNYLVGPKGIHSIDHEYGLRYHVGRNPSELYRRYHEITGEAPVADTEHLKRWIKYAPKLLDKTGDTYGTYLKQMLTKAHELSKTHGHVPLQALIPEEWHASIHGEPRGDFS
jgi:hypothetical protein